VWHGFAGDGYNEPKNVVSDMTVAVPSGGSYTAVGVTSDLRPLPTSPADSTNIAFKAAVHGLDFSRDGTYIAYKAESLNSPLVEFRYALHADVGSVYLEDGDIELLDGYVAFGEKASDPTNVANTGMLYAKDVTGVTGLFYRDSSGTVTRLDAAGGGDDYNEEEKDLLGTETPGSTQTDTLTNTPISSTNAPSGYAIMMFRNGQKMRYNATPSTYMEFNYNSGLNRVEFLASGSADQYEIVYWS
jgi:hypothetical protein